MFIETFEKEPRNIRRQNPGGASYSVTVIGNEKLFQIQTYGSPERQAKGVASQTLQFGKSQAAELIAILKKEFNL
jgi:hypothetical protein